MRSGAWALAGLLLMLMGIAPARAEWTEVSSDHFVIYGMQPPEALQMFAERLELFHSAMAMVLQRQITKPSPSNRLTVYVVPREREVRELLDLKNGNVAGVYVPNAGHSFALVQTLQDSGNRNGNLSQIILFHEYAHHFMLSNTSRGYPRWFSEGFAEFFSTAEFKDDTVGLGVPAHYRGLELNVGTIIPMRLMLTYDGGSKAGDDDFHAFYGESWALFHMLFFERPDQLATYQRLLAQGQPALQAAEDAFGDLHKLDMALERYVRSRRMKYLPIARNQLTVGTIAVRTLSAGENAVMPAKLRSRTGVTPEEAAKVVVMARAVADKFPDDAAVLSELAEAEVDSENYDAAIAAADRAISLNPASVNAWIQKGFAMTQKARMSAADETAWTAVRNHWAKANKVETDNPIPLFMYYWTFLEQEIPATPNAIRGLEWALALAPFDAMLRWTAAQQMISDGRLTLAASTLGPLVYAPHAGASTEAAKQLLADVQARLDAQAAATPAASSAN